MITSSEEMVRHEGGPLEKNHLKDMVQRNALETLVFNKITKHIETEKKAFTRQNSRDETEMKNVLLRLHQQQQALSEDGAQLSSDSGGEIEDETASEPRETDKTVNPYPVTIIPRFGASCAKQIIKQESTKGTSESRGHLDDHEDLYNQQPAISGHSLAPSTVRSHDQKGEWLGSPAAISSVRRPRKTVSDQVQRRALNRSQSEQNVFGDLTFTSSSPASVMMSPRDRSNSFTSLKENKVDGEEVPAGALNKRGGSLKERPRKNMEFTKPAIKPLARSYSMLSKASLQELRNKCGTFGKLHSQERKHKPAQQEDESFNGNRNWRKTKHDSLKEKKDKETFTKTNTALLEKQPLSRKSSNEGEQTHSTEIQQVSTSNSNHDNKNRIEGVTDENFTDKNKQGNLKNNPATYISTASVGFSKSSDESVLRTSLGPKRKQTFHPNRLSPRTSADASPNISPLARENPVFKY